MVQKTDLNVSPYYDDFDETDNFHRTLFRPGFAIQARELTQLQSVLQGQIENIVTYLKRVRLSFQRNLNKITFKLASTFASETIDPSQYYNATSPVTITGATSGVTPLLVSMLQPTDQPLFIYDM